MISISRLAKELNIEPYQLREWEKRGWLGADPVLKDSDNNNQRIYNEHQVERIRFILEELQLQKAEGFKRTNVARMNEKLLEKFGGEVIRLDTQEVTVSSMEEMVKLVLHLSKENAEMKQMLAEQNVEIKQLLAEQNNKLNQVLERQEEEKARIKERDERLMSSLRESMEAKKEAAAVNNKTFWQRLLNK